MKFLTTQHRALKFGATACVLAAATGVAVGYANADPQTWTPTQAELQTALSVAHVEANTSIPDGSAVNAKSDETWPDTVTSVSYVGTTRKTASQFVDGSVVPDDRRVVVLRMTGSFAVANSGPPGSDTVSTGQQMTVVIDAANGDVLDFGLAPTPDGSIPGAKSAFAR